MTHLHAGADRTGTSEHSRKSDPDLYAAGRLG